MRRRPLLPIFMLTVLVLSLCGQGHQAKSSPADMEWKIMGVDVLLGDPPLHTKQPLPSPLEDSGCCRLLAACN